ncbi:hypothetical protein L208DRAFT_861437 [Tricholoma matsutake]|nr:hypothetical protein L208DRAFT_861437 [Tricholoma matsutake 945]
MLDVNWSKNKSWRQSHQQLHIMNKIYIIFMSKHSRQQVSTHGSKYTCHVIFSDINKKVSVLMPEKLRRWVGSAAKPILMYMRQGPALPKNAILAAHGYKAHEVYDPVWRHVQVPEQFLKLVCPMAERLYSEVGERT